MAQTCFRERLTRKKCATTRAPGTPTPLLLRSSLERLSVRSSLSGMPQKLSRLAFSSTTVAKFCAPSPVMPLLLTSTDVRDGLSRIAGAIAFAPSGPRQFPRRSTWK